MLPSPEIQPNDQSFLEDLLESDGELPKPREQTIDDHLLKVYISSNLEHKQSLRNIIYWCNEYVHWSPNRDRKTMDFILVSNIILAMTLAWSMFTLSFGEESLLQKPFGERVDHALFYVCGVIFLLGVTSLAGYINTKAFVRDKIKINARDIKINMPKWDKEHIDQLVAKVLAFHERIQSDKVRDNDELREFDFHS